MAVNSESSSPRNHAGAMTLIAASIQGVNVFGAMARFGGKILKAVGALVKALQTARMMSVLSEMSDRQLAQIGIVRSDIPGYAQTLMSGA